MVRTVHQQPTYTARQPTSPHPASPVVSLGRDRSDPLHRRLQSTLELSEKLLPRTRRLHLTIQCRQLRFGQLPPLGIGKQPIETPRNMPHLEPHRRQSKRPRLQLLLREPGTPPRRILPRQFQSMQHPPLHHIVLRQCPAQPGFNHHSNLTPEIFLAVHPPLSVFILFITVTPSIRARPRQSAVGLHNPLLRRNSRTTSPTSRCCPSTASFIARTSSAVTFPANLSIAT